MSRAGRDSRFQPTGFGAQRDVFVDPLIAPYSSSPPLTSLPISSHDYDTRSRGIVVRSCRPPHAGESFAVSGEKQAYRRGHRRRHFMLMWHSRELARPTERHPYISLTRARRTFVLQTGSMRS